MFGTKVNQRHFVICRLRDNKKISRNECLGNYISRLSGIIQKLESEGWKFRTERVGNDYQYNVLHDPKDDPYFP